jgi:hypothetical protein
MRNYRSLLASLPFSIFFLGSLTIWAQNADEEELRSLVQEINRRMQSRRFQEALPLTQSMLQLTVKIRGETSELTAIAHTNIGLVYFHLERYKDSIASLKAAGEICQKLSLKSRSRFIVFESLAQSYFSNGDFPEAEARGFTPVRNGTNLRMNST